MDSFDDGGLAAFVAAANELELGVEIDRDLMVESVVADSNLFEAHGIRSVT